MRNITVKVHPSKANLKKKEQLAWKIAEISSDKSKLKMYEGKIPSIDASKSIIKFHE